MGYLVAVETDQLSLPSNSEFWVRMKRRAAYGDTEAAKSSMINVSSQTPTGNGNGHAAATEVVTKAEVGFYNRTLLTRMILEWNLTGVDEHLLPITEEVIDLLDLEDGDFLATEASKRLGRRTEAAEVPFEKRSGQRSRASR